MPKTHAAFQSAPFCFRAIHTAALSVVAAAALLLAITAPSPAQAATDKSASLTKHNAKTKSKSPSAKKAKPLSSSEVISQSPDSDWRDLDPQNTVAMELPQGQVLIELAPRFAPRHVANIRSLTQQGYYDGLAIVRVQDNFVTQWGDPDGDDPAKARSLGAASAKIPAEFSIPYRGLPLTRMAEADGWAPVTGFVDGFPVAAAPKQNKAWLAHCYGMVGAGRNEAADSSTGAELYAIIGHAPRALDLNITVVGRVLKGMDLLASLPRGSAAMGFYDKPEQRVAIQSARLLADIPASERPALQVMRSDSKSWAQLLDARRNRGGWYVHNPGRTELCGGLPPTRPAKVAG
ncbi:peptidylprolyl isomerase [Paucibacter sp. KCTC 42545]|uniref:peptidylprolyl isomerase n=1 Tax=Paucibacter sp. KCTC 42545 TaxID=1768242 RepID=UPI0009EA4A36|nr:peptidylprolyl isomerase [Paucibacter sp. KCTC 42545]